MQTAPVVVQFIGSPGAGKSTLIRRLAVALGGSSCVVLTQRKRLNLSVFLRVLGRIPAVYSALTDSSVWQYSSSAIKMNLVRILVASATTPKEARRHRAAFVLMDELGAVGLMQLIIETKGERASFNESLFATMLDCLGKPDAVVNVEPPLSTLRKRRSGRARRDDIKKMDLLTDEVELRQADQRRQFVAWLRSTHPDVMVIKVGEQPDVPSIAAQLQTIA